MAKIGGNKSTFTAGDHNVISDISGQKFKRSRMVFNWKNQLVDRVTEFEVKHPQLTIRPRRDKIAVSDARTQADDPALQDPPITASDLI